MALRVVEVSANEPSARGEEYGRQVATLLPGVWNSYLRLFRHHARFDESEVLAFGDAVLALLVEARPWRARELEGLATGTGMPVGAIAALNSRTELIVELECATIGRTRGDDGPWLAQNWDWYLDQPGRSVVVRRAATPHRLAHVCFTEAGMLSKIGVNEAGLAMSLNVLSHDADTGAPTPDGIHLLLADVLELCRDVADGVALLACARVTASSAVTLVDTFGDGATVELSPAGIAVLAPNRDDTLVHTNQFVDKELRNGDAHASSAGRTACCRYEYLQRAHVLQLADAVSALSAHNVDPTALCRHGEVIAPGLPLAGTAACIVMHPRQRRLEVGLGPTCSADFSAVLCR